MRTRFFNGFLIYYSSIVSLFLEKVRPLAIFVQILSFFLQAGILYDQTVSVKIRDTLGKNK